MPPEKKPTKPAGSANKTIRPVKRAPYKPPEPSVFEMMLPWVFIVGGVCAIIWLVETATPEKDLNCVNTGGRNSLTSFGTCTTE